MKKHDNLRNMQDDYGIIFKIQKIEGWQIYGISFFSAANI